MKKTLFAIVIILSIHCHSQHNYQKGIYMTFDEIIQNKPSANFNVQLEYRTQHEIKMNGGNDFQLNALDESTSKSVLKKDVVAYSNGESLYLNCRKLQLQNWYTKVVSDHKNYLVFSAGLPNVPEDFNLEMSQLPNMFGAAGGAFNGMRLAVLRFPYILDKSNQKVRLITDKNIDIFLENDKALLARYNQEINKKDTQIILNYLVEWNDKQ